MRSFRWLLALLVTTAAPVLADQACLDQLKAFHPDWTDAEVHQACDGEVAGCILDVAVCHSDWNAWNVANACVSNRCGGDLCPHRLQWTSNELRTACDLAYPDCVVTWAIKDPNLGPYEINSRCAIFSKKRHSR